MVKRLEGVYRHGKVELDEVPSDLAEETRVVVMVLEPGQVDLRAHGIDEGLAAELRGALSTFAEDWDSAEMAAYDDYDASQRTLPAR